MDVKIAHPLDALEYNKRFIEQITSAKVNQTQGTLGTPFIWGATNSWGGVRTRNFQYNQMEYADDIEPERIDEICTETMGPHHMAGCFGCQVHCRAQHKIPTGPYAGKYDEGPEYTSQGRSAANPTAERPKPFWSATTWSISTGWTTWKSAALSPGPWSSLSWES